MQRAGGECFFHSVIKLDENWNLLIQLWALPEVDGRRLSYVARSIGFANNEPVQAGDLIRGSSIKFKVNEDMRLIVNHAE